MKLQCFKFAAVVILVAFIIPLTGEHVAVSSAASSSDFTNTSAAISNAYALVYNSSVRDHADVSNLVAQLNSATVLLNKAYQENASNPTQATSDLVSATTIATQVASETGVASSNGIKVHNLEAIESIGVAVTIIAVSGLIYVFSDSIYRKWWIQTYRGYIVRLKKRNAG